MYFYKIRWNNRISVFKLSKSNGVHQVEFDVASLECMKHHPDVGYFSSNYWRMSVRVGCTSIAGLLMSVVLVHRWSSHCVVICREK